MSNRSKVLYTGFTSNLMRRVGEHKAKRGSVFTSRYNVGKLVFYEELPDSHSAKERERKIKGWLRAKKMALIESMNPKWTDLSLQMLRPRQTTLRDSDPSSLRSSG